MANVYKNGYFYLDTFSEAIDVKTAAAAAGCVIPTPEINLASIEWIGPSTVGHKAIITEGASGPPVFSKVCAVVNDGGGPKYYPEGFTVSNLNITGNTSTGVQSGALLIILQ